MNARVYAIKVTDIVFQFRSGCTDLAIAQSNFNRLLDVARETFKENVGDIMQLTSNISEECGIPISSLYQENGFVFCAKKSDVDGDFPTGFINITSRGQRWLFSSVELVCMFLSRILQDFDMTSTEKEKCQIERCAR